jgi:hypothetical protein
MHTARLKLPIKDSFSVELDQQLNQAGGLARIWVWKRRGEARGDANRDMVRIMLLVVYVNADRRHSQS